MGERAANGPYRSWWTGDDQHEIIKGLELRCLCGSVNTEVKPIDVGHPSFWDHVMRCKACTRETLVSRSTGLRYVLGDGTLWGNVHPRVDVPPFTR